MGSQTVIKIVDNEMVETFLDFKKPFESQANAFVSLADAGAGGTDVTWGFKSENGFMERIIFQFMSLEEQLGPQYEEGLASLKGLVEKEEAARAAAEAAAVTEMEEVVPSEQQ